MKTYLITNLRKQSNYEEDKINFEAVFNNELFFNSYDFLLMYSKLIGAGDSWPFSRCNYVREEGDNKELKAPWGKHV